MEQSHAQTLAGIPPFWFLYENGQLATRDNSELWWKKNSNTDAQIRTRYEGLYKAEIVGELDALQEKHQMLARIILLDQFSRNMFRDSPRAFFADTRARWLAYQLLEEIESFHPMEQVFILLPFEHSEALAEQCISLEGFQRLHDQAPATHKPLFATYLDFAQRHLNIVARFGRFAHRNGLLRRTSSSEEIAFLQQPGAGF